MISFGNVSDEQVLLLYLIGTFLIVAPMVLASAAFCGHLYHLRHPEPQ